jgi:hypothetical protein
VTHYSLINVDLQPLDIIDVSTYDFSLPHEGA